MRIKKLPIISALLLAGLGITVLSSYSTGIPGRSTIGCTGTGCHGAQSASTIIALSGVPAGGWVPGTPYSLTLTVTNTTKVAAGFDLTINVGSLTGGAGMTLNGTQEIHHSTPKNLVSGTTSWAFTWTAPASGATPLTVNVACNAVNLNTIADANDNWNMVTLNYNAAVAATAPAVVTTAATAITTSTATANGTVNANNANAAVTIQYGTTTAYGNSAAATPATVTGAAVTNVSRALSGLSSSTLYHYRVVAVNSAGTTNGADMTFTTAAAVVAPLVTTTVTTAITTATATVHGIANAGNASTAVSFEYGTTLSYGSTALASPSTVTGNVDINVSAALSGLLPGTLYHYRVVGVNSAGTSNGIDSTFTTAIPAVAPTVIANAATAVTSNSATGNGSVNANGSSTVVTIEYGTTASYGSIATATPSTVNGTTAATITSNMFGLTPSTLYHYRIKAVNAGGTTLGADMTFTTIAAAPQVFTTGSNSIGVNTANVTGAVNANNASTSVVFEYGTTTAYGNIAAATPAPVTGTSFTTVTGALSGLLASTTYHFRVVATNSAGTTNGADLTFTTAAAPAAPTVITNPATNVTGTSATANGSVTANNATTSISFEYGTTTAYGSTATAVPATLTGAAATSVTGAITGLALSTLYHYRVVAANSVGTVRGADMTFTTAATTIAAPTVVTTAATGIGSNSATGNGSVNANGDATVISIEYGPTAAYGSTAIATPGTLNGNTATNVSGLISGLNTSTTYHYRIIATNSQGTTNGGDMIFSTLQVANPPVLALLPVTNINGNAALLNGTVNTSGANATVAFDYGLSSAYGNTVNATPVAVTSFTPTNVSASLGTLSTGRVYHYRLKATSGGGTTYSADATFTTTPLSIGSLSEGGFAIYPNPTQDVLMLSSNAATEVTIAAYSLNGSIVAVPAKKIVAGQYQLDVRELANGNYLLVLKAGDKIYTTQFSKQ